MAQASNADSEYVSSLKGINEIYQKCADLILDILRALVYPDASHLYHHLFAIRDSISNTVNLLGWRSRPQTLVEQSAYRHLIDLIRQFEDGLIYFESQSNLERQNFLQSIHLGLTNMKIKITHIIYCNQ